jgi:hypothetical protein
MVSGFGVMESVARVVTREPLSATGEPETAKPGNVTARLPAKVVGAPDPAANVTLMVQEAPTAKVPLQFGAPAGNAPEFTRVKFAGVIGNNPPVSVTSPVLVTVASNTLLVVPAAQLPNASEPGVTDAARITAAAVNWTGEPTTGADPVIVAVPDSAELAVGV